MPHTLRALGHGLETQTGVDMTKAGHCHQKSMGKHKHVTNADTDTSSLLTCIVSDASVNPVTLAQTHTQADTISDTPADEQRNQYTREARNPTPSMTCTHCSQQQDCVNRLKPRLSEAMQDFTASCCCL